MNDLVRDLWATDLETTEVEQGQGALCRIRSDGSTAQCCLGRLIDIYEGHVGPLHQEVWCERKRYADLGDQWKAEYLPGSVAHWAGLTYKEQELFAVMNDTGSTFKEIAAHVRAA